MKTNLRGFVSLLLFLGFLVLLVSGVALFIGPKGRVANWTDWTFLGFTKEGWESVHVNMAILVLIASGFHLYLNWAPFVRYIKQKARWALSLKKEMAATVLIVAAIIAGAYFEIPPFSSIMNLNEECQSFWEERSPRAPMPHAEEFSLDRLARVVGLSTEEVVDALEKEGLTPENTSMTVRELGEQYGLTPSEVYAAIKKHHPEIQKRERGQGRGKGMGPDRGRGEGRRMGWGRQDGGGGNQNQTDTEQ